MLVTCQDHYQWQTNHMILSPIPKSLDNSEKKVLQKKHNWLKMKIHFDTKRSIQWEFGGHFYSKRIVQWNDKCAKIIESKGYSVSHPFSIAQLMCFCRMISCLAIHCSIKAFTQEIWDAAPKTTAVQPVLYLPYERKYIIGFQRCSHVLLYILMDSLCLLLHLKFSTYKEILTTMEVNIHRDLDCVLTTYNSWLSRKATHHLLHQIFNLLLKEK